MSVFMKCHLKDSEKPNEDGCNAWKRKASFMMKDIVEQEKVS